MIAAVRGEVLVRRPDHVVVESGGVGYRLSVSAESLRSVPAVGKQVSLHAHLVLRDDAIQLYGFASEEERDLFLKLTSVSGVGPKVGMAILSGGTPRELATAIAAGDVKPFKAASGVGKRTAERIIVELRERVSVEVGAISGEPGAEATPMALAREGLAGLGYEPAEVEGLLSGLEADTAEEMIEAALRRAGQGAGSEA